jgi:hypothetical protein|tara:strand:+ start:418 stop:864 length:447 start_codon:yes stop_codon:yes gene_type:complete
MPAGRPPKPIEQKRLLGNPGRRHLPDQAEIQLLPAATEVPEPERPLGTYGMKLWNRIWENGISWISPVTDIELLLMTCEMIDERWNLRAQWLQDSNTADGRRLDRLAEIIIKNLSLLGFTPTDRSRLGVAEVKKENHIEELRAKRNAL